MLHGVILSTHEVRGHPINLEVDGRRTGADVQRSAVGEMTHGMLEDQQSMCSETTAAVVQVQRPIVERLLSQRRRT